MVKVIAMEIKATLYTSNYCFFCHKVENFCNSNNITLQKVDINEDPVHVKKLIEIGGKRQVPCLVHDNKPLYESDDIIQWLNNKL